MKILHIILIAIGIFLLAGGVLNLIYKNEGASIGFHLNHPWYGIQSIVIAIVLLIAGYKYFIKPKKDQ